MLLFAGLGNPGPKYAGNRHNIGFMALDRIASDHGFGPWKSKFQAEIAEGRLGSEKVLLLKPTTFMNLSGQSVGEAMRFYKLEPEDVTVFHDELDLAPGKVRVKSGGGHAGHNGLRSLHQHIGESYDRVRLGIGHPGRKELVSHYVLQDFSKAEQNWLDDLLRGLSDGAAELAAGRSDKFLNAVALRTAPPRSSKSPTPKARPPEKADKQPPAEASDPRSPLQKLVDKFPRMTGPGRKRTLCRALAWCARIAVALILAVAVVGFWKREEITRLLAVNSLFDADRIVANFSNMNRAFLSVPVPRGDAPASSLSIGPPAPLPAPAQAWIKDRAVTSLLVVKDGAVVHETYHLGTDPDDLRIGWSVSKSLLSVLFGILVDDGVIPSLDAPVTQYVPLLHDSAYDGASILNILQMTAGVEFDEDYLDYNSDINRMGRVLALGGTMDGFAAGLTARAAKPGVRWKYVSIDTHILAMVMRGATGRDIPSLMSEKVIAPLGLEKQPYYLTDGEGVAFAMGGINMTTRDFARFGLMVARGGQWNGVQVVPTDWITTSTRASAPTMPGTTGYGYQWWVPKDARPGEVFARGIYGQYIYLDRVRDVVIVTTAADRLFRDPGVHDQNIAMFRAIADAL